MSEYIYPPPATLPPGSPVIAYMRDSGGPNQDESIGQQERVIQEFCIKHGLVLLRTYADTASGRKTKHRDQFLEMFNTVMTGRDDELPRGLILWAYSRFSRDVADFNYFLHGLLRKGLIIHSLTEHIPDGMAGQLMLSIKAYTNADFSVQLGKQIKRSIADRVKAGYNNGGVPPKGYTIERVYQEAKRTNGIPKIGVKWIPDPEFAPLVRLAWELRAQGASYGEIIKATNGRLYTSVNSWVSHFQNESYLGIGKAGSERIPDHHEPLITWEIWQAVKAVEKESKKRFHHRRKMYPTLLAGLAYCVHCGAAMVTHNSKGYRSYICGKRDRQRGFSDCPESHRVNAPKIERLILDTVLNRILSPLFAYSLLDEIQSEMRDTSRIDREIAETSNGLMKIERAIKNLMKLVETMGKIEEAADRLSELKRQQTEYTARISTLKAEREITAPEITPDALALVFETWQKQIQNAIESSETKTAKTLLSQFVRKIELGNKKAIIHYTYPVEIPADSGDVLRAHRKPLQLEWFLVSRAGTIKKSQG